LETLPHGVHDVLDVATGTGIWAIEFTSQYPSASVIGTDISPIESAFVPPNCWFELNDAEDPWPYKVQFDYIHMRAVVSCFRSHADVIKQAYKHTRPGGYLELQDGFFPIQSPDGTLAGTTLEEWERKLAEGAKALWKDFQRFSKYKQYMEEAGYVDIVETKFAWLIGVWGKDPKLKLLGIWGRVNFSRLLQGLRIAVMTRGLAMTAAEVEELLARVREEINSRKIHAYAPM
jgi:trans-aconitate methyltransferase